MSKDRTDRSLSHRNNGSGHGAGDRAENRHVKAETRSGDGDLPPHPFSPSPRPVFRSVFLFPRLHVVLFALFCSFAFLGSFAGASDEELSQVQSRIWNSGSRWVPGETSVSRLPQKRRLKRLGLIKSTPKLSQNRLQSVSSPSAVSGSVSATGTPPATLDYRNYNGFNYVTPIEDQGDCGSCWAFSTTAGLESQVLMSSSVSTDESEQILVSCSGAGDCSGGYIDEASDFIQSVGLPPSAYFPYTATNNSCSNTLPNWQSDTYSIQSWQWATLESPTVSAIKNALYTYGPLVTTMEVYTDFYYYTGGIYSATSCAQSDYQGGHAILIIGYDDTSQYFIVKNSWGTSWGEAGYFEIAYSQLNNCVEFGYDTIAYSGASQPGGSVSVTVSPVAAASAGAEWNVDGGAWQASGITISGLTAGSHTINFNTISGWTSPAGQTVTINDRQTSTASGTYVQQAGSLTATIAPQGAISAGAQWRVDGGAWQDSGASVSGLAVGQHGVSFAAVTGWTPPAGQTVTINDGQTTTSSGGYLLQPPAIQSFHIDGGAASTPSRTVTLYNSATGTPTDYMASESSVFYGATWEPYSTVSSFTLSPGNGTKTVYFRVRNAAGVSSNVSGHIVLAQLPSLRSFEIEGTISATGATSTTATIYQEVTLNNTATMSPTQFMASESPDFAGASWQPYSTAPRFALGPRSGSKTVYFKVQNSAGESNVMSYTIELYDRPTVASFIIDGGSASTSSRTVTLNNRATGPPSNYMASQSPSFQGAAWKPYSSAPSFTLSAGQGARTVYFKVRNPAGASNVVSYTITLN